MASSTELLSHAQILQKIDRIAFQIIEDNLNEKEIYIVGIANMGFVFAEYLVQYVKKNSDLSVHLIELKINKRNSIECLTSDYQLNIPENKVAILVDDVLNTGETLMHASHIILSYKVSKMRTAVMVDRRHRLFPIKADFAGLTLSTTLENHIEVTYENNEFSAFLD